MTGRGRLRMLRPSTYVLTAHEVALDFFRRGPEYLSTEEFRKLHPSFPRPRPDGLYHRASVEAWVDSTFGIVAGSGQEAIRAEMLEAARGGARSRAARSG